MADLLFLCTIIELLLISHLPHCRYFHSQHHIDPYVQSQIYKLASSGLCTLSLKIYSLYRTILPARALLANAAVGVE